MTEMRSEKISAVLTPSLVARLDAFRAQRRWSRSTAVAVLIEEGLDRAEGKENEQ